MQKIVTEKLVRFGPAGLGSVKYAIKNLETYSSLGLRACEIPFTYGIYIKQKEDAIKIGRAAKKLGIALSIHAPYWINLNSVDEEKVKKSKERILECCKVGTWLQAHRVVFHPGYYKKNKKEDFENIKNQIYELQKEVERKKYTVKLAPEVMGKINVFGDVDEIKQLMITTGCNSCIDFAHILARYKDYKFKEVFDKFKDSKELHLHFSGIVYGEKGEKYHKVTPEKELKKLIQNLPKNKKIIIINESPSPIEDSILGLKIYLENLKNLKTLQ